MNYLTDCINKLIGLGYEVTKPLPKPDYETININNISCPNCLNSHILYWMNRKGIRGLDIRPEYNQIGFICSNDNCKFKWRVTSKTLLNFKHEK